MPERFFLPYYENDEARPVYLEDVGNILMISGVLLQGMGSNLLLLTPQGAPPLNPLDIEIACPSLEEWGRIIAQSDNPECFVSTDGGLTKTLHRKLRYAISGAVQQRVWWRDGFHCVYCKAEMGKAQLTVDHFYPLELGGENDARNYVSACRRCNKRKGAMDPREFCKLYHHDFAALVRYLALTDDEKRRINS